MWHETRHVAWITAGVTGILAWTLGAAVLAWIAVLFASSRRKKPDRPIRDFSAADTAGQPLSNEEGAILAAYEEEVGR